MLFGQTGSQPGLHGLHLLGRDANNFHNTGHPQKSPFHKARLLGWFLSNILAPYWGTSPNKRVNRFSNKLFLFVLLNHLFNQIRGT